MVKELILSFNRIGGACACWSVVASLAISLSGCSRDDRPIVVLYASADEHIARQVIDAFESQYKVRVQMVGDTEAKKTTGLVERIRAERDRPKCDVFWSSEIFMTIELAKEDLLAPFEMPGLSDWPKKYRDEKGRWYGFAARARVIAYAPDRVPEEAIPKTWMDLTKARFKDRIVMADPRFGTTGGHFAAMKVFWDREAMPGYFEAFIEGLAANHVRMLPSGNAGVVDAIVRGEADVGMTDTDDIWAAQAQELNLSFVYPSHTTEVGAPGAGTLLIPNTAAIVKGAPHPEAAQKLMAFLLSKQVERLLAKSVSHNIPLRPAVAAEFAQEAPPDPLNVDYLAAAAIRAKTIKQVMDIFERVREAEKAPPPPPRPQNESENPQEESDEG